MLPTLGAGLMTGVGAKICDLTTYARILFGS